MGTGKSMVRIRFRTRVGVRVEVRVRIRARVRVGGSIKTGFCSESVVSS